jgi:hypothetical protein
MPAPLVWPSLRIVNLDRALRRTAVLVERPAPDEPDEVTRALARFLVVRTCGHLERVVQECFIAYVHNKSYGRVKVFSASWLKRIENPTPDRLLELVARFDGPLMGELRYLFEENDSELKREISLLIGLRNQIAHGESEGTGSRKALDLMNYSRILTDWFVRNFDPREDAARILRHPE